MRSGLGQFFFGDRKGIDTVVIMTPCLGGGFFAVGPEVIDEPEEFESSWIDSEAGFTGDTPHQGIRWLFARLEGATDDPQALCRPALADGEVDFVLLRVIENDIGVEDRAGGEHLGERFVTHELRLDTERWIIGVAFEQHRRRIMILLLPQ